VEEERGKRHGKRSDSRALSSPDDAVTPDCPWFSANSSQQPGQSQSPNQKLAVPAETSLARHRRRVHAIESEGLGMTLVITSSRQTSRAHLAFCVAVGGIIEPKLDR